VWCSHIRHDKEFFANGLLNACLVLLPDSFFTP